MITYNCPSCKKNNVHELNFAVTDFVCKFCHEMISVEGMKAKGKIKEPVEHVVLGVGSKGEIDGKVYWVVAIVVRKYGSGTFWREYYLKDDLGNDAFLSESNGHWVFLIPIESETKKLAWYREYKGKKYRWFETTPCNIHAASGFFEDKLDLSLSTYKEYVHGNEMISEESAVAKTQFFIGRHISGYEIKRKFRAYHLPDKIGVGMVQPFFVDIKQLGNVFGTVALLMCITFVYNLITRSDQQVFSDSIEFEKVHDKEFVTNTFQLNGASAPMVATVESDVDNSWANVELNLVNESTNEITYTSQDVEYYHGNTDGESWNEGSKSKTFSICGVPPGTYHLEISAQKQGFEHGTALKNYEQFYSQDKTKNFKVSNDGYVIVANTLDNTTREYDLNTLNAVQPELYQEFLIAKENAEKAKEVLKKSEFQYASNPSVKVDLVWKPVSFWNLGIMLAILGIIYAALYYWKQNFEYRKWSESSNSPYK